MKRDIQTSVLQRNNIRQFGKGQQTIMFAHGYGCDQNMWRFITPAFENEYKIVLFDHTGSGLSDISAYDFDKYSTLKGYSRDIIEICDELQLSNIIYVGHSVSSIIGVLASVKRPDLFEKLILIGPSPCYLNDGTYRGGFSREDIDDMIQTLESNYLGWSSHITPVISGQPHKPEHADELHNSFCRMDPQIARHFARVTFTSDNREDLSRVTVPTQIIQCHPDVIAQKEVGLYVHEQITGSVYTQIDEAGHIPHLTNPDKTIEAIKSFLK